MLLVFRIPENVIATSWQQIAGRAHRCLAKVISRDEILAPKHLIQHAPHQMHILVADLHEDAAGLGQQIAGDDKPVAQIGQIRVDAEFPRIAEGRICSGWRVASSALPSFTSRLRVLTCQLEPNLMP